MKAIELIDAMPTAFLDDFFQYTSEIISVARKVLANKIEPSVVFNPNTVTCFETMMLAKTVANDIQVVNPAAPKNLPIKTTAPKTSKIPITDKISFI